MQRIMVLTRHPESYSSQRFLEASAALDGVELALVDPHGLYLGLGSDGAEFSHPGMAEGTQWQHAIARLGSTATEYSLTALHHLEQSGVRSLNPHSALLRLRHKFTALSELGAAGIAVPETMMLRAPNGITTAVEQLGGYPVVLKFIRGSQGVGVVFADNESVAQSVLEALNLIQYDVLVQRFYPEAAKGDIRVIVIGGEARFAIRRESHGDFRSNYHRGGRPKLYDLDEHTSGLAVRAAGTFGMGFAGVDLVEDGGGGLLVMEINGSPGFEAIEQVHGRVVAEAVVEHVLAVS